MPRWRQIQDAEIIVIEIIVTIIEIQQLISNRNRNSDSNCSGNSISSTCRTLPVGSDHSAQRVDKVSLECKAACWAGY